MGILRSSKKIAAVIGVLLMVAFLGACGILGDTPRSSLGEYNKSVFFTSGEFRDYTDYGKYYYTSAKVEENKYFKKIQENDLAEINEHIDDFERWVEALGNGDASDEVAANYDFDRTIIDTEDYIYIESERHTWSDGDTTLENYDVYFLDVQTQVLYFFHSNT